MRVLLVNSVLAVTETTDGSFCPSDLTFSYTPTVSIVPQRTEPVAGATSSSSSSQQAGTSQQQQQQQRRQFLPLEYDSQDTFGELLGVSSGVALVDVFARSVVDATTGYEGPDSRNRLHLLSSSDLSVRPFDQNVKDHKKRALAAHRAMLRRKQLENSEERRQSQQRQSLDEEMTQDPIALAEQQLQNANGNDSSSLRIAAQGAVAIDALHSSTPPPTSWLWKPHCPKLSSRGLEALTALRTTRRTQRRDTKKKKTAGVKRAIDGPTQLRTEEGVAEEEEESAKTTQGATAAVAAESSRRYNWNLWWNDDEGVDVGPSSHSLSHAQRPGKEQEQEAEEEEEREPSSRGQKTSFLEPEAVLEVLSSHRDTMLEAPVSFLKRYQTPMTLSTLHATRRCVKRFPCSREYWTLLFESTQESLASLNVVYSFQKLLTHPSGGALLTSSRVSLAPRVRLERGRWRPVERMEKDRDLYSDEPRTNSQVAPSQQPQLSQQQQQSQSSGGNATQTNKSKRKRARDDPPPTAVPPPPSSSLPSQRPPPPPTLHNDTTTGGPLPPQQHPHRRREEHRDVVPPVRWLAPVFPPLLDSIHAVTDRAQRHVGETRQRRRRRVERSTALHSTPSQRSDSSNIPQLFTETFVSINAERDSSVVDRQLSSSSGGVTAAVGPTRASSNPLLLSWEMQHQQVFPSNFVLFERYFELLGIVHKDSTAEFHSVHHHPSHHSPLPSTSSLSQKTIPADGGIASSPATYHRASIRKGSGRSLYVFDDSLFGVSLPMKALTAPFLISSSSSHDAEEGLEGQPLGRPARGSKSLALQRRKLIGDVYQELTTKDYDVLSAKLEELKELLVSGRLDRYEIAEERQ